MGSLAWTLAIFGGAILFLHIILILWLKPRGSFWIRFDYVWIGIASLGLLTGTIAVSREIASRNLKNREFFVMAAYDHALNFSLSQQQYCCELAADEGQQDQEDKVACDWYGPLVADLEEGLDSDAWEEFYAEHQSDPATHSSFVRSSTRRSIRQLAELQDAKRGYEVLKDQAEETVFEETMSFLSPWLLAISLALRVTKTSAKLQGLY